MFYRIKAGIPPMEWIFIGEFQPIGEDFHPINEEFSQIELFRDISNTIPRYKVAQKELIHEEEISKEIINIQIKITFSPKAWQYAYKNDRYSRGKLHCFLVNVFIPQKKSYNQSYDLKLFNRYQSESFGLTLSNAENRQKLAAIDEIKSGTIGKLSRKLKVSADKKQRQELQESTKQEDVSLATNVVVEVSSAIFSPQTPTKDTPTETTMMGSPSYQQKKRLILPVRSNKQRVGYFEFSSVDGLFCQSVGLPAIPTASVVPTEGSTTAVTGFSTPISRPIPQNDLGNRATKACQCGCYCTIEATRGEQLVTLENIFPNGKRQRILNEKNPTLVDSEDDLSLIDKDIFGSLPNFLPIAANSELNADSHHVLSLTPAQRKIYEDQSLGDLFSPSLLFSE
jgi:hypothetical protein